MTVWLATTNLHKVREMQLFFQKHCKAVQRLSLKDLKNFLKTADPASLSPSDRTQMTGVFSAGGGDLKKTNQANRDEKTRQAAPLNHKLSNQTNIRYTPPEETGLSFKENARIKSAGLLTFLKNTPLSRPGPLWILGEDSGLEVTALKGRPGIYSARYSGPGATDQKNNRLLLKNLKGQKDRSARYVCALSCRRLFLPHEKPFFSRKKKTFDKTETNGAPETPAQNHNREGYKPLAEGEGIFEGFCHGSIALEERGDGGFGYDPVFIPRGEVKTLGELPPEFKEKISHRAQALKQFLKFLG